MRHGTALDERRVAVPGPVHRGKAIAVLALDLERDAEMAVVEAEWRGHLVTQVPVDAPAVDAFDDRAQYPPTARGVVARHGSRLPRRRPSGGHRERLVERHVRVVGGIAGHGEPGRVREHLPHRRRFLPVAPSVDVRRDLVVEPERAPLPELEDRDRRPGLARRVPEHHVVDVERAPGDRLADRGVEQDLATARHVDLGAEVPAGLPTRFEAVEHGREIRCAHGPRT
jgi:hypothetical protein